MSDLLGIVGSPNKPSKTRTAVEIALQAAADEFGIKTEILHLSEFEMEIADGRKLSEYSGDTKRAFEHIINSNAYLIGTPVYRGSYSGALKNLFDLIPRGKWQSDEAPFENRSVGFIATGATDHHYLLINQELGPIASFFGSYQVGGVYVNVSHFNDYKIIDEDVVTRLEKLGKSTMELSSSIDKTTFLSDLGPQF